MNRDQYAMVRICRNDNSFEVIGIAINEETAEMVIADENSAGRRCIAYPVFSNQIDYIRHEIRNDRNFWCEVRGDI